MSIKSYQNREATFFHEVGFPRNTATFETLGHCIDKVIERHRLLREDAIAKLIKFDEYSVILKMGYYTHHFAEGITRGGAALFDCAMKDALTGWVTMYIVKSECLTVFAYLRLSVSWCINGEF